MRIQGKTRQLGRRSVQQFCRERQELRMNSADYSNSLIYLHLREGIMVRDSIFGFYHRWHEIHLQRDFSLEAEYGFFSLRSSCNLSRSVLTWSALLPTLLPGIFFSCVCFAYCFSYPPHTSSFSARTSRDQELCWLQQPPYSPGLWAACFQSTFRKIKKASL